MLKHLEEGDPRSCWNKAKQSERVFVLLGRDRATPAVIRHWIKERIALGLNQPGDVQLTDAEAEALAMEREASAPQVSRADEVAAAAKAGYSGT